MRGSRKFPTLVFLQTCPSCSQNRGDRLRCPSASWALPRLFRPGSMRDEAVQTLSNQVAPLRSSLLPIIPPDECKGTTTPSLGGFNPFEQGRMGLEAASEPSISSGARDAEGEAGLKQGVSRVLHGESGKADLPMVARSRPGHSQLQVAPKALGREKRGKNKVQLQSLGAAGRDGPPPSTSILIPPPLQSWGPHANPPWPPKPRGAAGAFLIPKRTGESCHTPAWTRNRSSLCILPVVCQHRPRSRG